MNTLREKIAKLDYKWRFCGVPDESEAEWEKEGECIKQSSRALADQILTIINQWLEEQGAQRIISKELPEMPSFAYDGEYALDKQRAVIVYIKMLVGDYCKVEPLRLPFDSAQGKGG